MCAHEAALSEPHERVPEGDAEGIAAALAALVTAFDAVAGTDEALLSERCTAKQFYQRLTEVPFDDGDALYSLRLRAERARTVAESKRRKRKARSEDFVWERARGGAPKLRVRLYELRQLLSMREVLVSADYGLAPANRPVLSCHARRHKLSELNMTTIAPSNTKPIVSFGMRGIHILQRRVCVRRRLQHRGLPGGFRISPLAQRHAGM